MNREKEYVQCSKYNLMCQNGYFNLVKLHLDKIDVYRAFTLGCDYGHHQLVRLFYPYTEYEEEVFDSVCYFGYIDVVDLLLGYTGDIRSLHHYTFIYDQVSILRHILPLTILYGLSKEYSLRFAVTQRAYRCIRFLIQEGANIHDENVIRATASSQDIPTIKIVLRAGVNPIQLLEDISYRNTSIIEFVQTYTTR